MHYKFYVCSFAYSDRHIDSLTFIPSRVDPKVEYFDVDPYHLNYLPTLSWDSKPAATKGGVKELAAVVPMNF
jgi:hypothetical protein